MNRSFWFAAGAGAGIYASFRARRVAEAFTSDGISDRVAAVKHGGRLLREDIATAAAEKEAELREHLGASSGFVTALRASSTSDRAALPAAGDHSQEKELS